MFIETFLDGCFKMLVKWFQYLCHLSIGVFWYQSHSSWDFPGTWYNEWFFSFFYCILDILSVGSLWILISLTSILAGLWHHYCQVRMEVQIPHLASAHTPGGRCASLLLGPNGSSGSSLGLQRQHSLCHSSGPMTPSQPTFLSPLWTLQEDKN